MGTYTTLQGDMWDLISYKIYGDERHQGILMDSNPEHLDIFVFEEGTVLNVPDLKDIADSESLPNWRK